MINNLFSVFDPSSSYMRLSWILLISLPLLISTQSWKSLTSSRTLKEKGTALLTKEISFSTERKKRQEILILSIFIVIVSINFRALYPQVFSVSSHLTITLPLSLTIWLRINLFGWTKNTNHILSHLVPQGTPGALIRFMVLIEITRNIIRPITLCVRLTANIIAGHLLITLLGNSLTTIAKISLMPALVAPLTLTVLEAAVAFIQSYVFITLITLYLAETK